MIQDDFAATINNIATFSHGAYKASDNIAFLDIYENLINIVETIKPIDEQQEVVTWPS